MSTRFIILVLLICGFAATSVSAQFYKTGDVKLDASVESINTDAKSSPTTFKTETSATYSVSVAKIDTWSIEFGMSFGDIYLALEIGEITKKPYDEVIKVYQANKKKGWGAIAKELGIKPGSPEFHALKGNADTKAKKGKGGKSATPKPKDEKAKPKTKSK